LEEVRERKQVSLFTHRLSPESSDIRLDDGGRSPGFPHCWRLPIFFGQTVAIEPATKYVDHSCGDSSGLKKPVFPFNLLMSKSAKEPTFRDKFNPALGDCKY
jgi:hypothetical protein